MTAFRVGRTTDSFSEFKPDPSDRTRVMEYGWRPALINEIERVPSAEVEEQDLQQSMALSRDWISREEMKA